MSSELWVMSNSIMNKIIKKHPGPLTNWPAFSGFALRIGASLPIGASLHIGVSLHTRASLYIGASLYQETSRYICFARVLAPCWLYHFAMAARGSRWESGQHFDCFPFRRLSNSTYKCATWKQKSYKRIMCNTVPSHLQIADIAGVVVLVHNLMCLGWCFVIW